ncbi:MAG TPA: diguanylate cyclase [Syntrophomonas sp.]|nr:diguanylate cyclase [Syntrophomonas sp.]
MRRLGRVQKTVLLLLILFAAYIAYKNMYDSLVKDFYNTGVTKEHLIQEHIKICKNYIHGLKAYGDIYYQQGDKQNSQLFSLLRYDPALDSYNLDAIGGTAREKTAGNLTGLGKIPVSGEVREELNLALNYNKFFNLYYDEFPDVAWLYYTSASNFLNIYPWQESSKFSFSKNLKTVDFYTVAMPQNNPSREAVWTSPYLDEAGKGYMVTLSVPIYEEDTFKGVVSLDLTNAWLSQRIESNFESYLIDESHKIIAVSKVKTDDPQTKIDQHLQLPRNKIDTSQEEYENKLYRQGSSLVFLAEFQDAPWLLLLVVPLYEIIGKSLLAALPIILIGLFLWYALIEIEKRKKAEAELAKSLEELRSYQDLLSKAAKYDYLTNTLNRRGLKESFDQIVAAGIPANDPSAQISFIIGDIDLFKNFNDTYGHATGDKVLINIAELMKNNCSENDVVCRWGGEEFVIMLPGRTYAQALAFAEYIRKEIEKIVIPWEDRELKTSMTFGVQEGSYENTVEHTVDEADRALYIGKARGRNQVVGFRDLTTEN